MRLSIALAAVAVVACGASSRAPETISIPDGATLMRKSEGWVVSAPVPAFPFNSEVEPRLEGMVGAATATPFGCGLIDEEIGYFSGTRGKLACVTRSGDALTIARVGVRGSYARVFDAAVADGPIILADPLGRDSLAVVRLTPDGSATQVATVRDIAVDQAAVLPSGRLAVLGRQNNACVWLVIDISGDAPRTVSRTGADDRSQCHSSSTGGQLLRDQATGAAWLRPGYPTPNLLYRLDDNGAASPATRMIEDFAEGAPGTSSPSHVTIVDGVVWFERATEAGPVIGRRDLTDNSLTLTDLRASSGRWQDARRLYGLLLDGSPSPRAALMDGSHTTRIQPLEPVQTASAVTD